MCSKITWDIFSMIFYAYYDRKWEHFLDVKIYPSAADLKDFVSARRPQLINKNTAMGPFHLHVDFSGRNSLIKIFPFPCEAPKI